MQLDVHFEPEGDRRAHQLVVEHHGTRHVLARSVEGTELDEWPPSPATVQLDQCTMGAGQSAILGVGMGGASHWSMAIEAVNDATALVFDVACRIQSSPRFLGSTYRIDSSMVETHPDGPCKMRLLGPGIVATIRVLTGKIRLDQALQIVVEPDLADRVVPATVRWKYAVECRPTEG